MSENGRAESARDATPEETSIKSDGVCRGDRSAVEWSGDEHAQSSTVR